jgi:MoxR-like ATPase
MTVTATRTPPATTGPIASPRAGISAMARLRAQLDVLLDANTPLILWGPPGVGKSRMIEAAAAGRGWHCETVLGSIREPQDIAGFPAITDDGFTLLAPDYAQRIIAAVDRGAGGAILFLDEVSNCSPAQQAALLRVGTDRIIGDTRLPESCRIVFAANPPHQAADGWDLAPPLANRIVHVAFPAPDPAEWIAGLLRSWGAPAQSDAAIEARYATARGRVAGFISARPQLLHALPSDESSASGAWPSPRSWADLAVPALAHTAAIADDGLRNAVERDVLTGAVGEGAALEFLMWHQSGDLPDPRHLITYPDDYAVPERADLVHATLAAVTSLAISDTTLESWEAAWTVLARAVDAGHAEVAAVAARALVQARPSGAPLPKEIGRFTTMLRAAGLMGSVQ